MSMTSLHVVLVGNPNCGKTALFNQLTRGRQKVANYAGVTVERKQGQFVTPSGRQIKLLDLPGTYSCFQSASPDESIARDVLLGCYPGEVMPDLVVCVANAANLRLHLRFVLEVKQLGYPIVLALNMMDDAKRRGIIIDVQELQRRLDMKIVETIAIKRRGVRALLETIDTVTLDVDQKRSISRTVPLKPQSHTDLHAEIRMLLAATVTMPRTLDLRDNAIDRWALHPVIGPIILTLVMFLVFQAVYSVAKPISDTIGGGVAAFAIFASVWLPSGPLCSLITDGLIGGLGTVLGFLPQILVLFFFILLLEESGYLPRAAFLLDRMMLSVGLTGRSFIPLLSSFACAIPGVLGTRNITDPRDRLTTILVAPLMTCSARLPVYALLIGAFIPEKHVFSVFNLQGLVLFVLYAAGICGAMFVGWIMKHFLRGDQGEHALLMELPSYRLPRLRDLMIGLWERGTLFLKRLTGIILALTILMWFISTFPTPPVDAVGPAINYTFAGYIGRGLQFIFEPLGFTWQISLSLIPAFAARETAVAALATVYAVSSSDGNIAGLSHALTANLALPTALSLLVWFVFAPQCMSTLAAIRHETQSWRNVIISFSYMFIMAYLASLLTYQIAGWFA